MEKSYKVQQEFTDRAGKRWRQGDIYTGTDRKEIEAAVQAGNIAEEDGAGEQGQQAADKATRDR